MSTCFTSAAADRYFIRLNCLVSTQPWSCGLITSSIMQGALDVRQAQLCPPPTKPLGFLKVGLRVGAWDVGGCEEVEIWAIDSAKLRGLPFFQVAWLFYSFQMDDWNKGRCTFGNVTKLRVWWSGCVYCAECKSNSPSVHRKIQASRKAKKMRVEGRKNGESKRKALINLISTNMLDAVRQIWII